MAVSAPGKDLGAGCACAIDEDSGAVLTVRRQLDAARRPSRCIFHDLQHCVARAGKRRPARRRWHYLVPDESEFEATAHSPSPVTRERRPTRAPPGHVVSRVTARYGAAESRFRAGRRRLTSSAVHGQGRGPHFRPSFCTHRPGIAATPPVPRESRRLRGQSGRVSARQRLQLGGNVSATVYYIIWSWTSDKMAGKASTSASRVLT